MNRRANNEKPTVGVFYHRQYLTGGVEIIDAGSYLVRRLLADYMRVQTTPNEIFYKEEPLRSVADLFVPFFSVENGAEDNFFFSVAEFMEQENFKLLNSPRCTRIFGDKVLAIRRAASLGIPTLKTIFILPNLASLTDTANWILKQFSFPFIVKPRGLMKSTGVFKIETSEQLLSVMQLYQLAGMPFVCQEFASGGNQDIRIFFQGEKKLFAYSRGNPMGFISNASRQGVSGSEFQARKLKFSEIPDELIGQSQRLLSNMGCGLLCVDWFESNGKFYFNEVNTVPGTAILTPDDLVVYGNLLTELASN